MVLKPIATLIGIVLALTAVPVFGIVSVLGDSWQGITPTFIDEAVAVIGEIARRKTPGIFHVASSNMTTPFEFGNYLLLKARGVSGVIAPGSMEKFMETKGRTPRPRLGGLSTEKTQVVLGVRFRAWQEAVDEFVRQIKEAA